MREIRILLASPEELKKERKIASEVIESLNITIGKQQNFRIDLIRWETHSRPEIGEYPQQVLNKQFGPYDIFLGLFWKRIGTKTPKAISGTIEEYELAYDSYIKNGYPQIMIYFKKSKFYFTSIDECNQFIEVLKFKQNLKDVYYWTFYQKEFRTTLSEHLFKEITEILKISSKKSNNHKIEALNLFHYDGALLYKEDYDFLKEMEGIIREIIPHYQDSDENPIPNIYFMQSKNHIIDINIEGANLKSLPDTIANLKSLRFLSLRSNQLKTLPDIIGKIKKLEFLDVSFNQLESLPDTIGQLTSLIELYLSSNRLNILPDTIANLTTLQHLQLNSNNIILSEKDKKNIEKLRNSGCNVLL
jgi:hypothetical protein